RDWSSEVCASDLPGDGRLAPCGERNRASPVQFTLDLAGVDGVTEVVAGPDRHQRDEVTVVDPPGRQVVERPQQDVQQVAVDALVAATDQIDLAGGAALRHADEGVGVIVDVQPVPDVAAVAVQRHGGSSPGPRQ